MKAALIQLRVSSREIPEERWVRVEQLLSGLEGEQLDLIVLPELWSVGFSNFDRYEQEAGDLILRDKVTEFQCPLKTYSYQIELIHGGTTQFHFHSMMIEELVWDKKES